ncbi:U3 small nucleolar RNA-associated protein 6 homolog [Rana temporaria]|uniref:U3 small nucleolar RNA-associated protein 6 homolog n=1 Tax=Rana temporaria TaxID=8407 RepID=UPI001AAC8977|nr:U3 small nucleolar RNA-associated protein 6 homolog [Rana temporaria]
MAEFVQRRVEDLIPELEQLERVGLLTRGEVRSVIKKRTSLEYKLKRRVVEKEDFIGYVQYEINFLELLKKRRQRIGYSFKKEEIEYVIVQRIHQLFARATNKWKEDLQLWMSHIAFCKKWNCRSQLSKIFSSLLAVQADKPALWIMAAKWEFEDQLSTESARHLFLRALRFHPDSSKVYQEYFRMELMNTEKQRNEKEMLDKASMDVGEAGYSEAILNGELARVVYKAAVEKIKGAEFHLSLLTIAKKFQFLEELHKEILSDLQTLHADDPVTWDFLARQELLMKASPSAESTPKRAKAQEAARQEERCSQVYETALCSLHKESMWDLYITFCLERYKRQTNSKELKQQRTERLLSAFGKAHEAALLPPARYKEWISHLVELGQMELAIDVSSAATDRFGSSVDIWRIRLEVLISMKAGDVEQVFTKAFTEVKPKDSPPLWTIMVEWSEKERSAEDTEALYQKLVLNPIVTKTMKVKYLDWTYLTQGYKKAKKVFSSLHENRPFSEEFFQKMIDIEKEQEQSKMANLREYYERALREFGSTNPDLWLSYIKEELSHSDGKPENCGPIHWRAMKVLQGENVEQFINKYTLLQTGHL